MTYDLQLTTYDLQLTTFRLLPSRLFPIIAKTKKPICRNSGPNDCLLYEYKKLGVEEQPVKRAVADTKL
jgi:hypothetical protein